MKIEPGQIYYSANPANDNRRIRVLPRDWWGSGKVRVVTIDDRGQEWRPRLIDRCQFHATILTRDGNSRRRGYILEK